MDVPDDSQASRRGSERLPSASAPNSPSSAMFALRPSPRGLAGSSCIAASCPTQRPGRGCSPRIVGQQAARLLFTGEIIGAEEAKAIGYVLEVVPAPSLMDRALSLAAQVAKGAPAALAESKRLLYRGLSRPPMEHISDSTATITRLFAHPDFGEGVRAFLESASRTGAPPNRIDGIEAGGGWPPMTNLVDRRSTT